MVFIQNELLHQINPQPKCHTTYKEVTPPKYVYEYTRREEPFARPASAHPYHYTHVNPVYQPVPPPIPKTYEGVTTVERIHDNRRVEEENCALKNKVINY